MVKCENLFKKKYRVKKKEKKLKTSYNFWLILCKEKGTVRIALWDTTPRVLCCILHTSKCCNSMHTENVQTMHSIHTINYRNSMNSMLKTQPMKLHANNKTSTFNYNDCTLWHMHKYTNITKLQSQLKVIKINTVKSGSKCFNVFSCKTWKMHPERRKKAFLWENSSR